GIVGLRAQTSVSMFDSPLWARPLVALDALAFTLGKLIVPLNLAVDYGRHPGSLLASGQLWWTWLAPAVLTVAVVSVRRQAPWAAAAAAVFAAGLVPVLGPARFGSSAYSDAAAHP